MVSKDSITVSIYVAFASWLIILRNSHSQQMPSLLASKSWNMYSPWDITTYTYIFMCLFSFGSNQKYISWASKKEVRDPFDIGLDPSCSLWRLRTRYQRNQYCNIFQGIPIDCLRGTLNKNAEFNHADFPLPTIMQVITQWNSSHVVGVMLVYWKAKLYIFIWIQNCKLKYTP